MRRETKYILESQINETGATPIRIRTILYRKKMWSSLENCALVKNGLNKVKKVICNGIPYYLNASLIELLEGKNSPTLEAYLESLEYLSQEDFNKMLSFKQHFKKFTPLEDTLIVKYYSLVKSDKGKKALCERCGNRKWGAIRDRARYLRKYKGFEEVIR